MRVLNTSTLKLIELPKLDHVSENSLSTAIAVSPPKPKRTEYAHYAILSHTWGLDEVSFQELSRDSANPIVFETERYQKIRNFCRQARAEGYQYAWVDTCCIDKSSSAELSEAINSMFRWYKESQVCYVYLSDVDGVVFDLSSKPRWFTRGWTLQEALAPKRIDFYNKHWHRIYYGDQSNDIICRVTGIRKSFIQDLSLIQRASVPERFSWASDRETTREEDMAYCLLGIFDVHMPLLYGEGGETEFIRLQEEIIKESIDHTLFAWRRPPHIDNSKSASIRHKVAYGILATHPSQFRYGANLVSPGSWEWPESSYSMTNRGLCIRLPILSSSDRLFAILNCGLTGSYGNLLGIPIEMVEEGLMKPRDTFVRAIHQGVYQFPEADVDFGTDKTIYVLKRDLYTIAYPQAKKLADEYYGELGLRNAEDSAYYPFYSSRRSSQLSSK